MRIFNIGRAFARDRQNQQQADELRQEAENFKLATDGGWLLGLKYILFALFGYYNARLFITTVPGWEGWMTAICALGAEATALYCINNYTRSTGGHKKALGVFGSALTIFSIVHATISFFKLETRGGQLSRGIQFYAENVAFPLLFSLLLLAAVIIPLAHWRKKVAAEQARAQVRIATSRARLLAESAALRDESQLERERLSHLEEQLRIEGEYLTKLEAYAHLKEREEQAIARISNPAVREQVMLALGRVADPERGQAPQQQNPIWRGGQLVNPGQTQRRP